MQFVFTYYPYICISFLIVGFIYRYIDRPQSWNAQSSQILEKRWLRIGAMIFHYAVIISLLGHLGGLLIPVEWLEMIGITKHVHSIIAGVLGKVLAPLVTLGIVILFIRRVFDTKVRVTTKATDILVLVLISINAFTGFYHEYLGDTPAFAIVGGWLRHEIIFEPFTAHIHELSFAMKLHLISGFTILALIPYTRLVHIFTFPIQYVNRAYQVRRRRYAGE